VETFWNSRGRDRDDRGALVSSSFPPPDAGWDPAAPADVRSRPHAPCLGGTGNRREVQGDGRGWRRAGSSGAAVMRWCPKAVSC